MDTLPDYMVDRFRGLRGWFQGYTPPSEATIDYVKARTLVLMNRFTGLYWYVYPTFDGGIELAYDWIEIEIHPDADGNYVWQAMGDFGVPDLEPTTKFEDVIDWIARSSVKMGT